MIRCILTARDSPARLAEQAPLAPGRDSTRPVVWVDPHRAFQAIEGFGGAFTEAAALTWQALPPDQRRQLLQDYFDPVLGHGYTLCRVPMGSCDFALGNYAHAETPGDHELHGFTIERDRRALIPFIQAAQAVAREPIRLLASPWSPPAWMKTNGQMNHGGSLRPECRSAWARCFARFILAYEREDIPIWGVSVQNEPAATQRWDSCCYTAEEERDFVRDFLGPELERAGLAHVKILIWDHNRDRMVERAGVVYRDPQAARYVWGTGFHWYGDDAFDNVQLLHDAWPDKHLLFTEGCQEGGPHLGSWDLGERYARSIINDMNRWTEGWIDWNLLLDASGGPNHVGNYCSAPVMADGASGALMPQSSYFYLGHFARFVQRGARRVLCTCTTARLEATAFRNPDGSCIVVAMNRTESDIDLGLQIGEQGADAGLPPRAIATFISAPVR